LSINDLFSDLKKEEEKEEKEEKKEEPSVTVPEGTLESSRETPVAGAETILPAAEEVPEQEVPASTDESVVKEEQVSPAIPDETSVPPPEGVTDLFSSSEAEAEVAEEPAPVAPIKPMSAADLFAEPEKVESSILAPVQEESSSPLEVETVQKEGMFSSTSLHPVEALPSPILPEMPSKFDVSSDTGGHGRVFMIYGEKGESKTTLALSFPGKIYAISFDRKTTEVWLSMYEGDSRIDVKDALRYMNWSSPEARLKSSDISLRYIDALLDEAKNFEPDWILIDATGGYTKMAEMTMRYRNNIGMTEGVSWTYWTERRLYIKQLHLKALGIAKRGIIYTAFVGVREKIENNKIVDTMEQPKWVDVVKDETDVAIRVRARLYDDGMRYTAIIDSSKWRPIKTGIKVDITVVEGEIPDCFDKIVGASRSSQK